MGDKMILDKEIKFLLKLFDKLRIESRILGLKEVERGECSFNMGIRDILNISESFYDAFYTKLSAAEERCVYTYTDRFFCTYTYFRISDTAGASDRVMLIGPYLQQSFSEAEVRNNLFNINLGESTVRTCLDYYFSLERLDSSSRLFMAVETLCDMMWGEGSYSFHTESDDFLRESEISLYDVTGRTESGAAPSERLIELRYEYENEMMKAIESGQAHKRRLINKFTDVSLESRSPDYMRNLRNYAIIMNTLGRKSAEFGGVHPIHLDSVSRGFAMKIEGTASINAVLELMNDMFSTYCSLVKKYSLRGYAPPVQKAITYFFTRYATAGVGTTPRVMQSLPTEHRPAHIAEASISEESLVSIPTITVGLYLLFEESTYPSARPMSVALSQLRNSFAIPRTPSVPKSLPISSIFLS